MKKAFISFLLLCAASVAMTAQLTISNFKIRRDNPYGLSKGRMTLEFKLDVSSDVPLKYLTMEWYIVDRDGNVVLTEADIPPTPDDEFMPFKSFRFVGPFSKGTTYDLFKNGTYTGPELPDLQAFPLQIKFMTQTDTEPTLVPITRQNISTYFPKLKWRDINRKNPLH